MIHKYKPCAWHIKRKRANETLGRMIAKKYNVRFIKLTKRNKLNMILPGAIYRIRRDVSKAVRSFSKKWRELHKKIADAFMNIPTEKYLLNSEPNRETI